MLILCRNLGEILSEREAIANQLESTLDAATDPWGIKVSKVTAEHTAPSDLVTESSSFLKHWKIGFLNLAVALNLFQLK